MSFRGAQAESSRNSSARCNSRRDANSAQILHSFEGDCSQDVSSDSDHDCFEASAVSLIAELDYRIETVDVLHDGTVDTMFTLYSRYYDGTSEQLFRRDLADKQYVILLHDQSGELRGFSTAAVSKHEFEGETLRSFFSGDTIVDQSHWGQQALPMAWFRLTGHIKVAEPETPLYWFLLVKGHRTYRYLPTFFRVFFPTCKRETPHRYQALMDMLASERYGEAYDRDRGVVDFATSHGHLKSSWADIPDKDRQRPDVAFFLERNPGYVKGDELVCLTELAASNLRPLAERLFQTGMDSGI